MRKMFWCGVALMVAAAGGVYWAARCPNSTLARVVDAGGGVLTLGKPLGQFVTDRMKERQARTSGPDCSPAPCPDSPSESGDQAEPPMTETQRSRTLQLIDVRLLSEAMHPLDRNSGQEESESAKPAGEEIALPVGERISDLAPADPAIPLSMMCNNESSPIMPPCGEDREVSQTMPHCDEAAAVPKTMPYCDEDSARGAPAEESEPATSAEPPSCQEDPKYHYQYPGCPFNGGCPQEKKSPAGQPAPAGMGRPPRTVPPRNPAGIEETPAHPEVDTMEFRPSDARRGAFEYSSVRRPW